MIQPKAVAKAMDALATISITHQPAGVNSAGGFCCIANVKSSAWVRASPSTEFIQSPSALLSTGAD